MIRSYLVTFEVEGETPGAFVVAIKEYGRWARLTKHSYVIVTEETENEIAAHLAGFLGKDDYLIVSKITGSTAWTRVRCRDQWLVRNLKDG